MDRVARQVAVHGVAKELDTTEWLRMYNKKNLPFFAQFFFENLRKIKHYLQNIICWM